MAEKIILLLITALANAALVFYKGPAVFEAARWLGEIIADDIEKETRHALHRWRQILRRWLHD